jgi:hypothetical protein
MPKTIALLVLPAVVLLGGGSLMDAVVGRVTIDGIKPLNTRPGYSPAAIHRYWSEIAREGAREQPPRDAIAAERRFLQLDLAFPFFYGGALMAGLLAGATALGRRQLTPLFIGLVAFGMLADWVENTTQLTLLARFKADDPTTTLGWVGRVAGVATFLKLAVLSLAFAFTAIFLVAVIWRTVRHA